MANGTVAGGTVADGTVADGTVAGSAVADSAMAIGNTSTALRPAAAAGRPYQLCKLVLNQSSDM